MVLFTRHSTKLETSVCDVMGGLTTMVVMALTPVVTMSVIAPSTASYAVAPGSLYTWPCKTDEIGQGKHLPRVTCMQAQYSKAEDEI